MDQVSNDIRSAPIEDTRGDLRGIEASTAAAGWTIEYKQLDTGPAVSESIVSEADGVSVLFERHSAPIECIGETPKGFVTLVVPAGASRLILNGRSPQRNEIGVFGPGTELHGVTRAAVSAWNIHIPVERFVADREAAGFSAGCFQADRAEFSIARSRIRLLASSALPLSSGPGRSRLAEAEIADALIREAAASVGGSRSLDERAICAQRELRAARDYIRAHLAEPIRIPDVCRAAGVRQRTLERRFRSTYGLSPKAYVRACRLDAAHRALTDPLGCEASVTDVALRFGLTHLGRFARDYRAYFGCLPHEARKAP